VFLVKHCNDTRIVSPDLRELLIQTLNSLLQNPDYIRVFEEKPEARYFNVADLIDVLTDFLF